MILKLLSYLDPGTGTFILQAILAGILGGLVIFKAHLSNIFSKIKKLFGKKYKEKDGKDV